LYEDILNCLKEKTEGDINIRIEGHTSSDGETRNVNLSDGRAFTVAKILQSVLKGDKELDDGVRVLNNGKPALMPYALLKYKYTPLSDASVYKGVTLQNCSDTKDIVTTIGTHISDVQNRFSSVSEAQQKGDEYYKILNSNEGKALTDALSDLRKRALADSQDNVTVSINGISRSGVTIAEALSLLNDNLNEAKAKGATTSQLQRELSSEISRIEGLAAKYYDRPVSEDSEKTYAEAIKEAEKKVNAFQNTPEYKEALTGLEQANQGVRTINVTIQGYSYNRPMRFNKKGTPDPAGTPNAVKAANRRVLLCLSDGAPCQDLY
jgi:hypothetical protein